MTNNYTIRTYHANPDGSITFIKSVKESAQNANDWKDYAQDINHEKK